MVFHEVVELEELTPFLQSPLLKRVIQTLNLWAHRMAHLYFCTDLVLFVIMVKIQKMYRARPIYKQLNL